MRHRAQRKSRLAAAAAAESSSVPQDTDTSNDVSAPEEGELISPPEAKCATPPLSALPSNLEVILTIGRNI